MLYLPQTLSQPDNGMSDKSKGELAFQSPGIAIILLELHWTIMRIMYAYLAASKSRDTIYISD